MLDRAFFLICLVVSFYITIKALQKFSYSEDTLNSIISQFKTGYIEDIIPINSKENCPEGYDNMISNFEWPGSYKGCACEKGNSFEFSTEECTSLKQKCYSVDATPNKPLTLWRDVHLCYKRNEKNYIELINSIIPKKDNNLTKCNNSTHRICGYIDNLNNSLCLPKTTKCPVTKFANYNSESYKDKDNNTNLTITTINNITFIVGHSEINGTLYNQFRLGITQPCLNGNKSPSSELLYDLMKSKFDLTCEKYSNNDSEIIDVLYNKIDTMSYIQFLKYNNVYDMLNRIFSTYKIPIANLSINIYAKAYPGWSFECMKENSDTLLNFVLSPTILSKLSFLTILHAFIIILILIGIGVCAFFFIDNFDSLFYLIILGAIVLNLIYPIQVISNANWMINNISDEKGAYCGDESLNVLLYQISEACLSLLYLYVVMLCITAVCLIVYIIIIQAWIKPTVKEVQERLIQLRQM